MEDRRNNRNISREYIRRTGTIGRSLRRMSAIFSLYAQHALEYKSRSFVWFMLVLIECFIYLLFWRGALTDGGNAVWTVREAVSYYLLLLVAGSFLQVHIEEEMAFEDIQYGRLSQYLLRPFPYFGFKFFQELPWRIIQGAFGLITLVGVSVFVVRLDLIRDMNAVPLAVLIVMSAYLLCFVYKMIIGTVAFKTIDFSGMNNIQTIVYMLFSGILIPLHLLPEGFRGFALNQPIAYMLYYPVMTVHGAFPLTEMWRILAVQWAWIGAGAVCFGYLWKAGLRGFTSVGQ